MILSTPRVYRPPPKKKDPRSRLFHFVLKKGAWVKEFQGQSISTLKSKESFSSA